MTRKSVILSCLVILTAAGSSAFRTTGSLRAGQTRTRSEAGPRLAVGVTSEIGLNRMNETIVLDWRALTSRLPTIRPDGLVVIDVTSGKRLVYQVIDTDSDGNTDELIFQSDFEAHEPTKVFLIGPADEHVRVPESKVFARYVPERADDFAWENDRIAFRMYGKALEPTMVSSGVDVWAKRTRSLIIDKWYKAGEEAYHQDTGEGLDMYSVRLSRGCGGTGIWDGRRLHVSRNYRSWRVIANGPIRVVFELTYGPWDVNGIAVSEVKRITLDAGQNLNQVQSTLAFDSKRQLINLAIGIAQHSDWKGMIDFSREEGWFSRWENTGRNGSLGCAVVIDPGRIAALTDEQEVPTGEHPNHLVITPVQPGEYVRYSTGAGWDRSGDFAGRLAWNRYVESMAKRMRSPMRISFLASPPIHTRGVQSWAQRTADSVLATFPEPSDLPRPGWRYDNAFLLSSLLGLWQVGGDPRCFQYVKDWVDLYVDENGVINENAYHKDRFELDSILPGRLLIRLYQETRHEKYKKAAYALVEQLRLQPRTQDGGYWHKKVYPHQMWLDGLYMAGPYLVEFARVFDEPSFFDEAVRQITLIYRHTRDPVTGLLYHGWDESRSQGWADPRTGASSEFWGRAMGWYMMALVECLDDLPESHPRRDELSSILRTLAAALMKYQDPETGLWHQILDKGDRLDNWHETSCSAMFAYGAAKGVRKGYLSPEYGIMARKAYRGLLDRHVYLDDSGRLYFTGTVSVGTLNPAASKGDYDSYVSTPRPVNDVKGVAAFLWASLEMESASSRRPIRGQRPAHGRDLTKDHQGSGVKGETCEQ